MENTKQKIITVPLSEEEFHVGEKVIVYASMRNAFYSVLLAYLLPSVLLIGSIFLLETAGIDEVAAALYGLLLSVAYFGILYLFRHRISQKIKFTAEKTNNY